MFAARLWFVAGMTGVKDGLTVCAKEGNECLCLEGFVLAMLYIKRLSRCCAIFLFPVLAFAGKSLVISPGGQFAAINNFPNFSPNQSWRVEFQIHDWVLPTAGNFNASVFSLTGLPAQVWIYPNNNLAFGIQRDGISGQLSLAGRTNILVRLQLDASQMQVNCEMWNYDGTGYVRATFPIGTIGAWPFSGASIVGGATTNLAFLRVSTTLVAPGSRPPVTADPANYFNLKLDGNLNDSSGNGHNASLSGATYVNTPNQIPIAFPKTLGAPTWSNWTSLRAGHPSQLDGSASYSLADAGSSVSYFWQQLSGPSQVIWANRIVAMPIITGLVFGTYTFELKVTDAAGSTATTTLQTGAVAYDDNGVVIPSDPKVTQVYGPMIAFGQNPWGYEDERNLSMVKLQSTSTDGGSINGYGSNLTWTTPGTGTVSYPFNGKGGFSCTTLSGNMTASTLSIPIPDASCLSLASLPTWIFVGVLNNQFEMIRICSTTGTTGPQTLTACYDGRGISNGYGFSAADRRKTRRPGTRAR